MTFLQLRSYLCVATDRLRCPSQTHPGGIEHRTSPDGVRDQLVLLITDDQLPQPEAAGAAQLKPEGPETPPNCELNSRKSEPPMMLSQSEST